MYDYKKLVGKYAYLLLMLFRYTENRAVLNSVLEKPTVVPVQLLNLI